MTSERALELLTWMEKRRIQLARSGYRGRYGWVAYISDPGGHYQEERTQNIGYGLTIEEALESAWKEYPYP